MKKNRKTSKYNEKMFSEHEIEDQESLELTNYTNLHYDDNGVEIRVAREYLSVFELFRQEKSEKLIISPVFQRKKIWDQKRRSELIESILMGVPLPPIYLFENKYGVRQVIDGKQRISAIKDFINNNFELSGLNIYHHFVGFCFDNIPAYLQSKIEDYKIYTYIIQPPTPEFMKFVIFERINRGGVSLNKQEMRHALYQGPSTDLIYNISQSPEFKKSTGYSVKPERMRDCYLILRFISFYLLNHELYSNYKYSNVDSLLEYTMKYLNDSKNKEKLSILENICLNGMTNSYYLLGEDAFRFKGKYNRKRPVNMGLFEMIVFSLSYTNIDELESKVVSYRKLFNELKRKIDAKNIFLNSLDSFEMVKLRFSLSMELIGVIKYDNGN